MQKETKTHPPASTRAVSQKGLFLLSSSVAKFVSSFVQHGISEGHDTSPMEGMWAAELV